MALVLSATTATSTRIANSTRFSSMLRCARAARPPQPVISGRPSRLPASFANPTCIRAPWTAITACTSVSNPAQTNSDSSAFIAIPPVENPKDTPSFTSGNTKMRRRAGGRRYPRRHENIQTIHCPGTRTGGTHGSEFGVCLAPSRPARFHRLRLRLPLSLLLRAALLLSALLPGARGAAGAANRLRRAEPSSGALGILARQLLVLLPGIEGLLPVCQGMLGKLAARRA